MKPSSKNENKSIWKRPGLYMALIMAAAVAFCLYGIFRLGVLPGFLLATIAAIFILLAVIAGFAMVSPSLGKGWKVLGWIMAIVVTITSCYTGWTMHVSNQALANISTHGEDDNKQEGSFVCLYVLNNGILNTPADLEGRKIGVLTNMNQDTVKLVTDELTKDNVNVQYEQFDSAIKMVQAVKGAAIDGMILEQGYLSTLEEMPSMENIYDDIKALIRIEYEAPDTNQAEKVESLKPFTVYISGIDTRTNQLLRSSRSDVNLIATINPVAHEVLLISIPRDFYVETACLPEMGCMQGAMDKLTHTGLHGPETTEMTLEKLFGVDINYNIRVNFSSLVSLVNELGGITVNNSNDFAAGGYSFPSGELQLNGDEALMFVRERYSFADGDRERGRNQMRVLTGIIQKILSPSILSNFSGIMNTLSSSFETNMPDSAIRELIADQLSSGKGWTIYSFSVTGNGGTDYAAELGDNAYVMYPDQYTIDQAKTDILSVMNGEVPPYVNVQG